MHSTFKYLEDGLLSHSAWPALSTVEPLFHRETASVGLESLHQQVIDSSKMIVTFVLERLQRRMDQRKYGYGNDFIKLSTSVLYFLYLEF